jgi:hypothetical protein
VRNPKDKLILEEFRAMIDKAAQERWERDGRYSAKDILDDVRSDEKLWKAIAEQFAERIATTAIRERMKARQPDRDPAQLKFPFANEIPVPSINFKGTVVSTLRASSEEYLWFEGWFEKQQKGIERRNKADKKTLARVHRLGRIVRSSQEEHPRDDCQADHCEPSRAPCRIAQEA